MTATTSIDNRRYRRRIAGWGAFAFVLIFVVGLAAVLPAIERNLEQRTTDRLVGIGLSDIDVSFSGQDATLRCAGPLAAPEAARDEVRKVDGVRGVDLDDSCLGDAGDGEPDQPATDPSVDLAGGADDSAPDAVEVAETEPVDADTETGAGADTAVELETVREIIERDEMYSTFAALVDQLDVLPAGDEPITVFVPTNDAFDLAAELLGSDAYQELLDDPDRLASLLRHHVAIGLITTPSLVAGSVEMVDGTVVDLDVDDEAVRLVNGDSVATLSDRLSQRDILAIDGVVHAVDRLLFPASFDEPGADEPEPLAAELASDVLQLSGTVASDAQRELILASTTVVEGVSVIDELSVGADVGPSDQEVGRFAQAVGALNAVVEGRVDIDGDRIVLEGTADDELAVALLRGFGLQNDVVVLVVSAEG